MAAEGRIVIAAVARPHGVRGGLRVKVFNPETEMLAPGQRVRVTPKSGEPRELEVLRSSQAAEDIWLVWFRGIDSVEAAEELRGAEISVAREQLPPLEEGEFYHADLVGCEVRDTAGALVGVVREVARYPSVDALVVPSAEGELEVPLVEGIVTSIDIEGRTITIDVETLRSE